MMDYVNVTTQTDLDGLLDLLKTNELFVREAYYKSNAYLTEETIVAPQSLGDFHLIILGEDEDFFGIHLIFINVSSLSLALEYDLNLRGRYTSAGIEFYLMNNMGLIQSKNLKYAILDKPVIGDESIIYNKQFE